MTRPEHDQTFVIVGAGQAGAWTALTLRRESFAGRVVLIGAEPHPPYERPPLSKAALVEGSFLEGTILTPADAEAAGIELWLATRVTAIDRSAATLRCEDGRVLAYDRLVLTTGGAPRLPPFARDIVSDRLHVLRTREDAARLSGALKPARRVIVIGGGWIGLETAASCRTLGIEVTLLEAADRLCARSLPAAVSDYLRALHERHGVTLVFGARCAAIEPSEDKIAVRFEDGARIEADQLVIGTGISPNVALAEAAGLALANGILVDRRGVTSDPNISAAGDVACHPSRFAKGLVRLECWANAQNQAIATAKAALGTGGDYDEVPWFWSDQYGVNLQILGLPDRGGLALARGAPRDGQGLWMVTDAAGTLAGLVAVNAGGDLRALRKLVASGATPDHAQWGDLSVPIRKIAAGAVQTA